MPPFRRAAVVLLTLTLAGCATEVVEGSAAPADPAGPLSTITDRHLLVELEDRSIITTAVDPDGEPILLLTEGDRGPLELWRRAGDGWEETTLDDHRVQTYGAELGTTSDGTVVVTGYAERGYVITRVSPDGEVSSVPVAEDVDHETTKLTRADVTPAGDLVYLAYLDEESETRHLLAVDPVSGETRAEQTLLAESGVIERLISGVSPDGEWLLAVNHDLDDSGTGDVTTLVRYDADLEVLADVSIVDDGAPTEPREVDVDAVGTAYVTVVVGADEEDPYVGTRVFTVDDGASSATEVYSTPDEPSVDSVAVDPTGTWLYLVGQRGGGNNPASRTVTPVDLTTGDATDATPLCPGLLVTDLHLTGGGAGAAITMHCESEPTSSLWTLGIRGR